MSPSAISLPKGPGSIEGLGESFQPTLNTGTAGYGIALSVPPGTAGQQPGLGLRYEGGGGNGVLGYGWSLPLPVIQRRSDKGIPLYGEDLGLDRPDRFINENKEELVPQTDGYWFCENEGTFIRYRFVSSLSDPMSVGHWEGTRPDGTKLEFGLTPDGRIEDATTGRIFSWLLERETDTRGNTIVYAYRSFPGDENRNQKFLGTVTYGPGAPPWENFHFVVFEYEDRSDWFEDGRAGFIVRGGKRINRIVIGTQGPDLPGHLGGDWNGDGQPDFLNRQYELSYLDYAGADTHWSLLARVQVVGADGTSRMPPTTFGYSVCNPPDTLSAAGRGLGGLNEPALVMDSEFVELADLNGDGLPDLLRTFGGGLPHQAFLNQGVRIGTESLDWQAPQEIGGDARAWNVNLQSATGVAHLADMDGDGLADLAVKAPTGEVFFFSNRGNLNWGDRRLMSAEDVAPPSPFGRPGVRTADLDFDKRIDIIQSLDVGGGVAYRIWFNLGDQRYAPSVTVEPDGAFDLVDPAVQIADFNGDRVPDLVRVQPDRLLVKAGLGYGRFAETVVVPLPDFTLNADQVRQAKLTDVTGNGLADLVIERAAPGQLWYWINRGNYRLSARKQLVGMPLVAGQRAAVRWADMNGNGTTDLVYADSESEPRLQTVDVGEIINGGVSPNILNSIVNGLGRTITIEYQSSITFRLADEAAGVPWPNPIPFAVPVVASVRTSDSLGHEYLTEYRYHDGYYDPQEKQFRGFARVEQIEIGDATAPTLVSRSFFDTGSVHLPMKGKLLRQMTEEADGRVYWEETTTWTIPPLVLKTGTNGQSVNFVHPTAHSRVIKELGQGTERVLESEVDYDEFGNQILSADYGVVEAGDRSAFNDERLTRTEYAINPDQWIVRLPKRTEIADGQGAVISRTEYYYDDESFSPSNFGQVLRGNLTLQRDWIDPGNPTHFIQSSRTYYDAFGNAVLRLDPLAEAAGGVVDLAKGHAREVAYDRRFHSYAVTETIHVGAGNEPLVFGAVYDEALGTLTSTTDFNRNTTLYGYDPFARLTAIIKPGDSSAFPTSEYSYALAVPVGTGGLVNYVETRQRDRSGSEGAKADGYFYSRHFIDGLGRNLMIKHEAEPASLESAPRVVVTGAVQFNARRSPSITLNPHFSTLQTSDLGSLLAFEDVGAPGWKGTFCEDDRLIELGFASAQKTLVAFDATLREVMTTHQDGTHRQIVYEPLRIGSYDENQTDPSSPYFGAALTHYQDGLGRLVRVEEITRLSDAGIPGSRTAPWSTSYEYDVNNQLTAIVDAQHNVQLMNYDGLQRKIFMNDPDRGEMYYIYDEAANLVETLDARRQRITYTYDGANRLLTETYAGSDLSPRRGEDRGEGAVNVAYHYDEPAGPIENGDGTQSIAQNTRGMLAYVSDASGEEHTSFDARGRVQYVVKRIADPVFLQRTNNEISTVLASYRTVFEYDSFDRLTALVYPDNDQVLYEYNQRNLIARIVGGASGSMLSNVVYWPSGQEQQMDHGNQIRTSRTYDPRLRLRSVITHHVSRIDDPLLHFSYDFDGVSNITSIEDERPGSVVAAGDKRRNTQFFDYDDLYRLTRAQYSFNLPGSPIRNDGSIDYRYDRIGNMLAQTSNIEHGGDSGSVTDLGEMQSGGSLGAFHRRGRAPSDPPGPHALTAIENSRREPGGRRTYDYDANGNMTDIDGLACTWDFKDRLVMLEDATMKAEYIYDYSDRRILKVVKNKGGLTGNGPAELLQRHQTVIYVDKYFEVRDHDAPIKYVFNKSTRVARVAGSLSANARLQRLRVYTGWNLCSLAVTATNLVSQLGMLEASPAVEAAYRWDPESRSYLAVAPGESVPSGTVCWLKASANLSLSLTGAYSEPANIAVPAGGSFVAAAGLEAWHITGALPATVRAWKYHSEASRWSARLSAPLEMSSDWPGFVAPGEAVFIAADAAVEIEVPEEALRIHYYHQDHLGSSSCVSDADGRLVEENAFYPFGHLRLNERPHAGREPYKFGQVERDAESGLDSYPARYRDSLFGRFLQPDPLYENNKAAAGGAALLNPQKLNIYAYARNNPVKYVDPSGLDEADTVAGPPAPATVTPFRLTSADLRLPVGWVPAASQPLPTPAPVATAGAPAGMTVTLPAAKPDAWQRANAAREDSGAQAPSDPKSGSAGDVVGAVGKMQLGGQSLEDRAKNALTQRVAKDWGKATTGEKAAVIGAGVVMVGVAAPALQKKESVRAIQMIVPKVEIPIPLGKGLELKISVGIAKPDPGLSLGGTF